METSDWISAVNVVVMGILTFFIYKATSSAAEATKGATRAAEEKFSQQIFEHQQNEREKASAIRRKEILTHMKTVIEVLDVQLSGFINSNLIQNSPLNHGLTKDELATYFDLKEAELIIEFWEKYIEYVDTHWKNSRGDWKDSGFDREESNKLGSDSIKLQQNLLEIKKQYENVSEARII